MKTLYIDCGMGAAGDMLTAALLELTPDPAAALARLNGLGIPGVVFEAAPSLKCGIRGTHVTVRVHGDTEDDDHGHHHDHEHEHDHEHHHDHEHEHDREHDHHHHTTLADVARVLEALDAPEAVKRHALAVYESIARAESHVHGVEMEEIHFHEVGTMDAIADVTAVCYLMDAIRPDRVLASPIRVGSGTVRCAHGLLPVPAPATAFLLQGLPIYGGDIPGEMCTPTGAALLRHFVDTFGPLPPMRPEALGYGMGTRDFPTANCVRAMLGEDGADSGTVTELICTVDDMTAEEIAFAAEQLMEGGALDVYTAAITMKKGRPGTLIHVLCRNEDRDAMAELVFRCTSTLGMRETRTARRVLDRRVDASDTPLGVIRTKYAEGYGVRRSKLEYEDLARIAREAHVSLADARRLAEDALSGQRQDL